MSTKNVLQSEQALLGILLRDGDLPHDWNRIDLAEQFVDPVHRRIYDEAWKFQTRVPSPIDLGSLSHRLGGVLDEVGGRAYLHQLVTAAPAYFDGEMAAKQMVKAAVERALIDLAEYLGDILPRLADGTCDLDAVCQRVRDAAERAKALHWGDYDPEIPF